MLFMMVFVTFDPHTSVPFVLKFEICGDTLKLNVCIALNAMAKKKNNTNGLQNERAGKVAKRKKKTVEKGSPFFFVFLQKDRTQIKSLNK